jgi:hypothetical protein
MGVSNLQSEIKSDQDRDFSQRGQKAVLTEDVSFFTGLYSFGPSARKRVFPKGTTIELDYYQAVSGLYMFKFEYKDSELSRASDKVVSFPLRHYKFRWL